MRLTLLFLTLSLAVPQTAAGSTPADKPNISPQDKEVLEAVEKVAPTVKEIARKLWDLSEVSLLEIKSSAERDMSIEQTLDKIKHLPIFVLQGDEDGLVVLTRRWVSKMQEMGMQYVYAEIPGGDHSLVISQNSEHMKKFVDFFNIVRKKY